MELVGPFFFLFLAPSLDERAVPKDSEGPIRTHSQYPSLGARWILPGFSCGFYTGGEPFVLRFWLMIFKSPPSFF